MFKAGDRVRKKNGENFSNDQEVVTVDHTEEDTMFGTMVWLKETDTWVESHFLEYAEETKQTEGKQMQKVIFTYSQDSATVVVDGQVNVVTSGEASFEALVEELKKEVHDIELIKTLVNKKAAVQAFAKGNVEIKGSTVYFQGEVVSDSLTDKMLQLMDEGFDISPWVAFYENLQQNPSFRSRKCLFNFLEKFQAPFTEDGCFVAFKRVDQDFKDLRTHTMDNSVGAVVKMDRSQVDDDPGNTCSSGLHVAASSYLNSYASASRAKTIMLKVNPRDVVAVPHDYNFAKMRVCQYEVIADITVEQMKDLEKRGVIVDDWAEDSGDDSEWEIFEGEWEPEEGDRIQATESALDITEGETYTVEEVDTSDDTVRIYDDVGDSAWLKFDGSVA
jgi:hypothetical protein